MTHFSDNQNCILLSLSNALFSCKNILHISDIPGVVNESIKQGVPLLVAQSITVNEDDPYYDRLNRLKDTVLKRNMQISWVHKYAAEKMKKADIPYVIMKGIASARYYPEPNLRSLGDVDLLVPEENIEKACELFCKDGYEKSHENHDRHIVLAKNSVRIELHRKVTGIPDGDIGKMIEECFDDIFEKSRECDGVSVPGEFHHLLILLLHTAFHIAQNGIGLRHLCDYAVFINRYSKVKFDNLFSDVLKKVGLYDFALVLAQVSKDCFGYPDYSDFGTEISEELLIDIFSVGSFGIKNPVNTQQSLFSDKGTVKKANAIVCNNWKSAKKHPLLLPVGYVYFSVRYLSRSILGKREKIDLISAKNSADKRKKLCFDLKLFKEETK